MDKAVVVVSAHGLGRRWRRGQDDIGRHLPDLINHASTQNLMRRGPATGRVRVICGGYWQ